MLFGPATSNSLLYFIKFCTQVSLAIQVAFGNFFLMRAVKRASAPKFGNLRTKAVMHEFNAIAVIIYRPKTSFRNLIDKRGSIAYYQTFVVLLLDFL